MVVVVLGGLSMHHECVHNNKLYLYHGQRGNMTVHIHTFAHIHTAVHMHKTSCHLGLGVVIIILRVVFSFSFSLNITPRFRLTGL